MIGGEVVQWYERGTSHQAVPGLDSNEESWRERLVIDKQQGRERLRERERERFKIQGSKKSYCRERQKKV